MKKIVISLSGGMDSSVLLFMALANNYEEVHTLTFDYGQRHKREIECVNLQIKDAKNKYPNAIITNKILDIKFLKDISPTSSLTNTDIDNPNINKMAGDAQPASYVPFRNQMFLSICCAYGESMEADTVWYGAAEVDSLAGYWDGDITFVNSINNLISLNRRHKINIEAPLLTMSKSAIIHKGIELGVRFDNTWTCYSNTESGLADPSTPSSSLRIKGFIDSGYVDPVEYLAQDTLNNIFKQHSCKMILNIIYPEIIMKALGSSMDLLSEEKF